MGRKYTIRDSTKLYFVSFATVNWIDVFIRKDYCNIIVDSLNFCLGCVISNGVPDWEISTQPQVTSLSKTRHEGRTEGRVIASHRSNLIFSEKRLLLGLAVTETVACRIRDCF